jgi:siroheme synthase-like protein
MAEAKCELLAEAGASVRLRKRFDPTDAEDAILIVADVEVEEAAAIREFGRKNKILVNIVDKPAYCSFIVPAIVERGDLLIGISTSGQSPALAGWIRAKIELMIGPEYRILLEVLRNTREKVKQAIPSYEDRKRFYYRLFNQGFIERTRSSDPAVIEEQFWRELEKYQR